ncbi:hypothetical protein D3C80_1867810 [compost metagenome]
MVTAPTRNDLLLFRPAEYVVVIPNQLDVGLVGIGPGKAEIDTAHIARCPFNDHPRQCYRRFGAMTDIGVIIGQ